jgi:RNA polymerase primary sigma factor
MAKLPEKTKAPTKRSKRKIQVDDEMLRLYFQEIDRYPLLKREEEGALCRRIKQGDTEALEILTRSNLRFVVSVALKYQNLGLSLSDLIAEGNVGLMRAAHKFDEKRKVRFISYAVWWIRQAILQAISEQSRVFRVPLNKSGSLQKIGKATSILTQTLGREPTEEEIANHIDMDRKEMNQLLKLTRVPISLDQSRGFDSDDSNIRDYIPDENQRAPDEIAFEKMRTELINHVISMLNEREATILKLYYGLGDREPMTLEEIGAILGVTRERVRQIKERAIEKLGEVSKSKLLETFLS